MRLIDADALKREIPVDEYGHIKMTITRLNIALEHSKVDVEPVRHGHWAIAPNGEYGVCSRCAMHRVDLHDGKEHNYCEVCGAKMDEKTT